MGHRLGYREHIQPASEIQMFSRLSVYELWISNWVLLITAFLICSSKPATQGLDLPTLGSYGLFARLRWGSPICPNYQNDTIPLGLAASLHPKTSQPHGQLPKQGLALCPRRNWSPRGKWIDIFPLPQPPGPCPPHWFWSRSPKALR